MIQCLVFEPLWLVLKDSYGTGATWSYCCTYPYVRDCYWVPTLLADGCYEHRRSFIAFLIQCRGPKGVNVMIRQCYTKKVYVTHRRKPHTIYIYIYSADTRQVGLRKNSGVEENTHPQKKMRYDYSYMPGGTCYVMSTRAP